jgi:hypothetical protein
VVVSLVGLVVLNAQYAAGWLPLYFIVWIFVPFSMFGLLVGWAIRWGSLWRAIALAAVVMCVVLFALGARFGLAYWCVMVPASGMLAATAPNLFRRPADD